MTIVALLLVFGRRWLATPGWSGPPQVSFLLPQPGQEVGLDDALPIQVKLTPPEAPERLELWIDGVLSESLSTEDSAEPDLTRSGFVWRPGETGPHVLIARAAFPGGRIGSSRPLIVRVVDETGEPWIVHARIDAGETLESLADVLGVTSEDILGANPEAGSSPPEGTELSIPVSRARLPAGYVGDDNREPGLVPPAAAPSGSSHDGEGAASIVPLASPRELPNGLTWRFGSGSLPEPPAQITVMASGGCTVEVRFTDASRYESGFRIYRWGPANPDFSAVVDLDSNREFDSLVFRDQVPFPGMYMYYVASVNAWGEAPSEIARGDVSQDGCNPEQAEQDSRRFPLQLEVLELTTTPPGAFDATYCYLSLAFLDASHVRLPTMEDVFFTRRGEGWDIAKYASGSNRFAFYQLTDESIPFGMECWGWEGEELINLGSFDVVLSPQEWLRDLPQSFTGQGSGEGGAGFRASYRISLFLPESLELVPVDNCMAPCYSEFPAPYGLHIPDTVGECIEGHVNLEGGNLGNGAVAAEWACRDIPPEQMLTWEWDETVGVPRSQTQGFVVYTYPSEYAYSQRDAGWIDAIGSAAQVMPRHIPPCDRDYLYQVAGNLYEELAEGSVTEIMSPRSGVLEVHGPPCPERSVSYNLQLTQLSIQNSSDVDGLEALCFFCDEDVTQEAYGLFRVGVVHGGVETEVGRIVLWDDACISQFGITPCGERTRSIRDGEYDLAQEDMTSCDPMPDGSWTCRTHERMRSRIAFTVYDGDQIWTYLTLFDHDTATGDDIFCDARHTSGIISTSSSSWRQEGSVHPWYLFDENSEATCTLELEGTVLAVIERPGN